MTIDWSSYMREVYSLHLKQRLMAELVVPIKIVEIETNKSLFICRKNKKQTVYYNSGFLKVYDGKMSNASLLKSQWR